MAAGPVYILHHCSHRVDAGPEAGKREQQPAAGKLPRLPLQAALTVNDRNLHVGLCSREVPALLDILGISQQTAYHRTNIKIAGVRSKNSIPASREPISVQWLNYHHLLYFWTVAKEGGISRAAEQLHLAQPTLSSQIKKLERAIGADLFDRVGRSMVLTETGQIVYRYADEIFALGREMTDTLRGRPSLDRLRLAVGVPDVLPKLVVYQLLRPALDLAERTQLVCYEGKLQDLLADLAVHRLDIVLADCPVTPDTHVRAFNHLLGECGVSVFGTQELSRRYRAGFPASLNQAPMLLPTQNTSLRRALEQWFDDHGIQPLVMHEFEDSAVMKVFGQGGEGLFVAPSSIEKEVCQQYCVRIAGRIPTVKERFYAISIERRLKHPAVVAISTAARKKLAETGEKQRNQ
jgi:LysR family transcriptional activator of nhaA